MSSVKKKKNKETDLAALFLIALQSRELLKFHQLMGIEKYHGLKLKEPPEKQLHNMTASRCRKKATPLKQIEEEIQKCSKCHWREHKVGKIISKGPVEAKLMIVGDFMHQADGFSSDSVMGRKEDLLLEKMIAAIELDQKDVFITNLIKCRAARHEIKREHGLNCQRHLIKEIEAVQPKIIMAMGEMAAQILCNRQEPLLRIIGKFYPCSFSGLNHIKIMATLHPVRLKDIEMKKIAWRDLQAVQKMLNSA